MGNEVDSKGKYYRITVPDYGTDSLLGDAGSPRSMTSYLRLGAVPNVPGSSPPQPVVEPGDDLAKLVKNFVDDTRNRDSSAHPIAARQAESAKLHTRGGWLDHSDGNRISTTRGDKVEVIRGNYKMVVLGRYPVSGDPTTIDGASGGTTSWDSSGGHIQDWRVTPGAVTEITWVESRGTWKVIEKTEKGDVHSVYNGEVKEEYYGPRKESITGTETPNTQVPETNNRFASSDNAFPNDFPVTRENPVLVERTWAQSIESYTGSEAVPIPTITEKTWANTIESHTGSAAKPVGTITEKTYAGVTHAETYVGLINETTFANTTSQYFGTTSSMQIGNDFSLMIGPAEGIKLVGPYIDIALALKVLGINIAGNVSGINVTGTTLSMNVSAATGDVQIGPKDTVAFGLQQEVKVPGDITTASFIKRLALAIFLG